MVPPRVIDIVFHARHTGLYPDSVPEGVGEYRLSDVTPANTAVLPFLTSAVTFGAQTRS